MYLRIYVQYDILLFFDETFFLQESRSFDSLSTVPYLRIGLVVGLMFVMRTYTVLERGTIVLVP